jgi:hypothetical protein
MARIPRPLAGTTLSTGGVVQFPSQSPVGGALAKAGSAIQNVAARWRQQRDELDTFKTNIARELSSLTS